MSDIYHFDKKLFATYSEVTDPDNVPTVAGLILQKIDTPATTPDNRKLLWYSSDDTLMIGNVSLAIPSGGGVGKLGDTMLGTLQLPAGSTSVPSLCFTNSETTGLSANSNTLSLSTNGVQRLNINGSGAVQINGLNSNGVIHTDTSGNLTTSQIINADISGNAAIADTKLATITSTGKVANSATTATSNDTVSTIVARDASGNFSAGTITAALNGNAATATSASNFTNPLAGNVTGTQGATVVSFVGGQSAVNVAAGAVAANAATNANTVGTIVKRDLSGNFAAGTITAALNGNAATATIATSALTANSATSFSGSLVGDVTGVQGATVVSKVGEQSASSVAAGIILANAATNANTASTIVKRDASGNFLAGTITANLTGSASSNVLKSGDTMIGHLNLAGQSALRWQDAAGGQYVGLAAPATIPTSYNLTLPANAPSANQILTADGVDPTILNWATIGANLPPSSSKIIYVGTFGNDTTGNGSLDLPYLTLGKAIQVANLQATISAPVTINMYPGVYVEDNSSGPLLISADGISIIANTPLSVVVKPNTLANNLLNVTATIWLTNIQFNSGSTNQTGSGLSTANCINFNGGTNTMINCSTVNITGFNIGISLVGGGSFLFSDSSLFYNNIGVQSNNVSFFLTNCVCRGTTLSTGIYVTGSSSLSAISGGIFVSHATATSINNNSTLVLFNTGIRLCATNCSVNSGGKLNISGGLFNINNNSGNVTNIVVTDNGSKATLTGVLFNNQTLPVNNQIAVTVVNQGTCILNGCIIENYTTACIVGTSIDTSATALNLYHTNIISCTNDITHLGAATLNVASCSLNDDKFTFDDATNINLNYFDNDSQHALTVGVNRDVDMTICKIEIGENAHPAILYKTDLYGAKGFGYENNTNNPAIQFAVSTDHAITSSITTDNTKIAGLKLVSDTATPIGASTALRGWDIIKNGSSAELAFLYQNSDTAGQSAVSQYTLLQLDGLNNQLQLPATNTQIVFSTDTKLYRSSANVLKTDGNLIIDGLTASRALITNASKQLSTSVTTDTEIGYLSGVTSAVQTQFNNKVNKNGDTMTGSLQLPAGTTNSPALRFTGSSTTGLSAISDVLSLSTGGFERIKINASGAVQINGLNSVGIVHTDINGSLSTSAIVNTDISASAAIADSKLATITTPGKIANSATSATNANTGSTIVLRDVSGNFSAGTITATLNGNASTATSATTATTATSAATAAMFTGSLAGDVIGSQGGTIVNEVGGLSASAVATGTAAANAATSTNTNNAIVKRDSTGNFSTNMITISGTVTNSTDVATKQYVDDASATGIVPLATVRVVSANQVPLNGLQTIDSVALADNDRVILVGQTDTKENGLWVVHTSAWIRPADFTTGGSADRSYVLVTEGIINQGSSWLCQTPTATIDTDPIAFIQFSLPNTISVNNVGTGEGQLFKNKIGTLLEFKTIKAGTHVNIINNTNDITLTTNATASNTVSTIVARDASGNFSAGAITANLTGSASNNVLKAGDTMTGHLNLAGQSALRWQDAAGGQYVGLAAPATIPTSYNLTLPANAPTVNQLLMVDSMDASILKWAHLGSNSAPTTTNVIYVGTFGNDVTGNGSLDLPYLTLAKAIQVANLQASDTTPVDIMVYAGIYVEDNSSGPLAITSSGISIRGKNSPLSSIIRPNTLTNDLLTIDVNTWIADIQFDSASSNTLALGSSSASAIVLNGTNATLICSNLIVSNFNTGINCISGTNFILKNSLLLYNNTAINTDDITCLLNNNTIQGTFTSSSIGLNVTGSNAIIVSNSELYAYHDVAMSCNNNCSVTIAGGIIRHSYYGCKVHTGSRLIIAGSTFTVNVSTGEVINLFASDTNTSIKCTGSVFQNLGMPTNNQTAIKVVNQATCNITSSFINNYTSALIVGENDNSDTSTTALTASALHIGVATNHLIQYGTSSVNITTSNLANDNVVINDATNIHFGYFDSSSNNSLVIGTHRDTDISLIAADIGANNNNPQIKYLSDLYSSQAIGYHNGSANPATLYIAADDNTMVSSITTDRAKMSKLSLLSDMAATIGGSTALRGWDIIKNGSSAELAFLYQNSDTVGQSAVSQFTLLQLDGLNNQLQLPATNTQIVFSTDTKLYRSSANVLKTDGNLIIDGLTASRVLITNTSKQLSTSVTTDTEIGYLSGVTSAVQTQFNNKVNRNGDTMTGSLQLPAGTTSSPALRFTGSSTTGLSANSNELSISTAGAERININASGNVRIIGLNSAGVVHTDANGSLATSAIVNADISASAAISDSKLATISTAGKVANSATSATNANTGSTIVLRDVSGNFSAGTITATLNGNASTATTASSASTATNFTGQLSGDVIGSQGVTIVNEVGGQSASNVATGTAAANAATNLNTVSTIVKRDSAGNFSAGTITATLNGNASTATTFTTSLVGDVTGTRDATQVITVGNQSAANIATGVAAANAASNDNNLGTIVKRDGLGNFSAGTITATLNGNASTATSATSFTGLLSGNVTGAQDSTVVEMVGNQSAANVAAGTVLANAATNLNTANAIVRRDASGDFSANRISSALMLNGALSFTRATFNDAPYVISTSNCYVGQIGSMSASRTVTLPNASAVAPGGTVIIADESGTVTSTNTIVISRAGSNTINGNTTFAISVANGSVMLVSDGTSKWTTVAESQLNLSSSQSLTGLLSVAKGGTNSGVTLNNNRIMISNGGSIVEAGALTNGQLLIGSTGAAPVARTLTGTTDQIIITDGAGTITLSTPQSINVESSPTFNNLTLTGALSVPIRTYQTILWEEQANNVASHGGLTFAAGSWVQRFLTNVDPNGTLSVVLSTNTFSLSTGTYKITGLVPGYTTSALIRHQARLYNNTTAAVEFYGQSSTIRGTSMSSAPLDGIFVVPAATTYNYSIEHRSSQNNTGFGIAMGFGNVEKYTFISIEKIAN
jgi:hypothetical protein